MKITNKLNLPEPFSSLVLKDTKQFIENRFSVTELLKPTREIVLIRKYNDSLSQDVSDMIQALFGTALHELMEKNTPEGSEVEIKLEYQIGKYTIVGKIDRVDGDVISDYKTCKVNKVIKNSFDEDRLQGLMYAYIRFMKYGIKTKKLKFYNLMKDWSKMSFKSNYPTSPIYIWEYDISDSDYDFIERYMINKLKDVEEGFNELPKCSESDKWYTGTKYAVYKKLEDKRATIVCDTEQEAKEYIENKCGGNGHIVERQGENLKCNYYCLCRRLCYGES